MSLFAKLERALREEGVRASAEKAAAYIRRWQDERRSAKLDSAPNRNGGQKSTPFPDCGRSKPPAPIW